MDKYLCKLDLGQEILNGEITAIKDTYRANYGPTECGYDIVEISVNKGEKPIFRIGDKNYIGYKVEKDNFISELCPIN